MMIRNWRDQIPYIGHESKVIWPLFRRARPDDADAPDNACPVSYTHLRAHET